MSAIHIILQGKGGVGKSLVAAFIAQYFGVKNDAIYCADTDPVNDTFARYKSFGVKRINIMNGDNNINARAFDGLVESLVAHEGVSVIDNGASTFVPLSSYLAENDVIELLQNAGKEVFVHTVLTGGQAIDDTMSGLNALLKAQPAPIVVWENEFFGEVSKDGFKFKDTILYRDNADRIRGIIKIHKRNQDTFGKDMELLVSNKMTFDEAMTSDIFTLMPRQRLRIIQRSIYDQLEHIGL
jgi:cellulose biosynthesis protein BcsQ